MVLLGNHEWHESTRIPATAIARSIRPIRVIRGQQKRLVEMTNDEARLNAEARSQNDEPECLGSQFDISHSCFVIPSCLSISASSLSAVARRSEAR
jgi:hypothetical protein